MSIHYPFIYFDPTQIKNLLSRHSFCFVFQKIFSPKNRLTLKTLPLQHLLTESDDSSQKLAAKGYWLSVKI